MTIDQAELVIQAVMIFICVMSLLSLKKQKIETNLRYLIFVFFLALIMNVGYFLELMADTLGEAMTAVRMEYVGTVFGASFLMFFAFEYCGKKIPELLWDGILAIDLVIVIFVWVCPVIPGFYTWIAFKERGNSGYFEHGNGPVFYVEAGMLVAQAMISLWFGGSAARKEKKKEYKKYYRRIEVAMLLLLLAYTASITRAAGHFDIVPAAVAVCSYIIGKEAITAKIFDNRSVAHASIIRNLGEPVIISDSRYRYMEANEKALEIFPYLKELNRGDEMEGLLNTILRERKNKEIISDDYIFRTDIQHIIDDGKIEGYAVLLMDLTKDVKQLNEMTQLKNEAEEANHAKSEFLAKMSHEIRTPINAVLGMDEMILRESGEQETRKYAMDIKTSAQALLSIINEILDASKIESGKMEIVCGNYELSSLLNDLYNMIDVRARQKGLELIFDVDESVPSAYFGDDVRIRQVLVNILNNAVKYTQQGTVRLTLRASVSGDTAVLSYAVTDTGIGIKKEDIGKMFSEYTRINDARNRYTEGTGLGMNITVSMLRMMGSKLQVESEYGKGSTFYFDLEQKIVNKEPVGNFKDRILQNVEAYEYETGYIAPEAKILVVDDNEMNRKVFCSLLKQTQMQISQAGSGFECIQKVKETKYDLIFMDHMMPEMDGIETLHEIQREKLCEGIPIVVLTANAITGARENYMREGFDDFLTKPIAPAKLDDMVLKYLPPSLVQKGVTLPPKEEEPEPVELPELEEFDFEYALRILREESLLRSALEDFYHSLDGVAEKLSTQIERISTPGALDAYRIEVHALKSTAATVGALLLSKLARLLEVAAREKETEKVLRLHPVLLEEITKHKERLKEIMPPEEEKPPADMTEIGAYFEMLRLGLEQENYETIDFIFAEINKYQYAEKIQKLVDELGEQIMNLESEEALETVAAIKGTI